MILILILRIILSVFLILFLNSNTIFAQCDSLIWIHPQPTGNRINKTVFYNSVGIGVGGNGTIIRTENEGLLWTIVNVGDTFNLNSVSFIDSTNLIAVGNKGIILRSDNGGRSWKKEVSIFKNDLVDVSFPSLNQGYLLTSNGYVFTSTNSGLTWSKGKYVNHPYNRISFIYDTIGFTFGGGGNSLSSTKDGGKTWQTKWFYSIRDLFCLDKDTIFLITGSTAAKQEMYYSYDGGEHWVKKSPLFLPMLMKIYFKSSTEGYVISSYGMIYETRDGAKSWNLHSSSIPASVNLSYFQDAWFHSDKWIFFSQPSFYIHYSLKEKKWISLNNYFNKTLYSFYFFNIDNGFVIGENGLLKTIDGGKTWKNLLPSIKPGQPKFLNVQFVTEKIGYIVGERGLIRKTIDGGITWIDLDYSDDEFTDLKFQSEMEGFVIGSTNIMKTVDGGSSWEIFAIPSDEFSEGINEVEFINEDTWYACTGYYPKIVKTTDGGKSWRIIKEIWFNSIDFIDEKIGYASGKGIYKTTDGGETWSLVLEKGTEPWYTKVRFLDSLTGYASSDNYFFKTTDGGRNWEKFVGANTFINSFNFVDKENLYFVGYGGTFGKIKVCKDIITYNFPTSINRLNIFPNPNLGKFFTANLENTPLQIKIFNSIGDLVQTTITNGNEEIEIINKQKGIYFLEITSNNKRVVEKILVE